MRRARCAALALFAGAIALVLGAGVFVATLPGVEGLGARGDPGPPARLRAARCEAPQRRWRSLESMDARLGCAVLWSEDARFFQHDGVDWPALGAAAHANLRAGGLRYGAGTLAMQLARTQYLTPERSLSRKLREIVLARRLTRRYEHRRLLELYLNAAEWAPCVFGAEAAARHYFGHGAEQVTLAEASLLAAMLPRPTRRPPLPEPGHLPASDDPEVAWLLRRQHRLIHTFAAAGLVAPGEARLEVRELFRMWAVPGAVAAGGDDAPPAWRPVVYGRRCHLAGDPAA